MIIKRVKAPVRIDFGGGTTDIYPFTHRHGGAIVNEYTRKMKEKGRLHIYRLPSYSPDYNPIEKLWKNTKRDSTHCKFFPTFDDLRSSVIKAFKKYMEDATKVICVMKKLASDK